MDHERLIECPPYTESAAVYNTMMAEVDYDSWADYLLDIIEDEEILPESICDISCGTGILLGKLKPYFKKLAGYDSSDEMLRIMRTDYPDIPCFQGDMNALPAHEGFDVYLNVHDALNYFQKKEEIRDHLRRMAGILKPGAVYIFDFALPPLIRRYFMDVTDENEGPGGRHYLRKNSYDEVNRTCLTEIYVSRAGERETIYLEKHVQKIYTLAEIQSVCNQVENMNITLYREFSFDEAGPDSERVLGIMRHD